MAGNAELKYGDIGSRVDYPTVVGLVDKHISSVIDLRRAIHAHPELAFKETATGRLCADTLAGHGIDVRTKVAGTGVVGLLEGAEAGPTIAIRADMDGLPIEEATGLPYRSQLSGVAHSCGHDGHVAIALGAAMMLSEFREHLKGNVKFIFQPAEEQLAGAVPMIEQGALDSPSVDCILALHLWPDLPFGHVGVDGGVVMAACDRFSVAIKGKGGHGANPHLSVDAIAAASLAIMGLQTVVSREVDPVEAAVLSIGTIHGGTAFNTIADKVELQGTVRVVSSSTSETVHEAMLRKLEGISCATRTECHLDYARSCPAVENDQSVVERVRDVACKYMGENRVHHLKAPSMIAEDFAYYLERTPGAMIFLGTGRPTGNADSETLPYPLHHPKFSFDEEILRHGVLLMTMLVLQYLRG